MPLSAKQHHDIICQHWHLLWPLPHRERQNTLDQLILDAEYEDQLRCVEQEMGKCVIFISDLPPHLSASL